MSLKIRFVFNDEARNTDLANGIGFSALVGDNLLFDTGNAGKSLIANMKVLGIDPMKIRMVVISHNHWDHIGGLNDLLSANPDITVYGCPGSTGELKRAISRHKGSLIPCSEFMPIGPGILITGEMPSFYKGEYLPEQAVVLETENGISIITGCAHPGIVSIIDRVKEYFSADRIYAIAGGFHLKRHSEEELQRVLDDLAKKDIAIFAPMHCTGDMAIPAFSDRFGNKACILKSGDTLIV